VGWRCINKNGKGQLSTYKELFAEIMLSGLLNKEMLIAEKSAVLVTVKCLDIITLIMKYFNGNLSQKYR
jgi:hypothetical protein